MDEVTNPKSPNRSEPWYLKAGIWSPAPSFNVAKTLAVGGAVFVKLGLGQIGDRGDDVRLCFAVLTMASRAASLEMLLARSDGFSGERSRAL